MSDISFKKSWKKEIPAGHFMMFKTLYGVQTTYVIQQAEIIDNFYPDPQILKWDSYDPVYVPKQVPGPLIGTVHVGKTEVVFYPYFIHESGTFHEIEGKIKPVEQFGTRAWVLKMWASGGGESPQWNVFAKIDEIAYMKPMTPEDIGDIMKIAKEI